MPNCIKPQRDQGDVHNVFCNVPKSVHKACYTVLTTHTNQQTKTTNEYNYALLREEKIMTNNKKCTASESKPIPLENALKSEEYVNFDLRMPIRKETR